MDEMSALTRLQMRDVPVEDQAWHVQDKDLIDSHPQLAELLFCTHVGDTPREAGRLSLFMDEGKFKCCIGLPSEGLVGFVSLSRLTGLLDELERLVSEDKVDWRPDKRRKPPR